MRLAALALFAVPLVANTALVPFTNNGVALIQDTTLNVTWIADANLFASQYGAVNTIVADAGAPGSRLSPGTVSARDFRSDGTMSWVGALAWVNYLNQINYAGYSNWVLPTGTGAASAGGAGCPAGSVGCGPSKSTTSNQLGYLFINELGNAPGSPVAHASPFLNITISDYWSATGCAQGVDGSPLLCLGDAWRFDTGGSVLVDEGLDQSFDYALVARSASTLGLAPATLSFGTEVVGATGMMQPILVTNNGPVPVALGTVSVSNHFTQTNNCSASLAAGGQCTVMVAFAPTAAGALTVPSGGGDYVAALSGTAMGTVTISASSGTATVGMSITLTWTASPGSTCSASSSSMTSPWSGSIALNGTATVNATAASSDTYTIHCTAPGAAEVDKSVSVTWSAAASTGGVQPPAKSGGGAFELSIIALLGIFGRRFRVATA